MIDRRVLGASTMGYLVVNGPLRGRYFPANDSGVMQHAVVPKWQPLHEMQAPGLRPDSTTSTTGLIEVTYTLYRAGEGWVFWTCEPVERCRRTDEGLVGVNV